MGEPCKCGHDKAVHAGQKLDADAPYGACVAATCDCDHFTPAVDEEG